ncbi:MAG: hypothetical protein EZS28_027964 [Streblomastix strix]|uniref:Uncharacterized protein n=1 Tax=Streblomastix strix TaxID=222440 RepID=A0A5J4V197_9EUKA|nr:MAG: hypothetical protein EZS28_027964 [Streblomastix strix]
MRRDHHNDTLAELLNLYVSEYQMSVCLETPVISWQKGVIERDAIAWPWAAKINKQKFDSIIKKFEKDNTISKKIVSKITRKCKESDFDILNFEIFKDE